MSEKPDWIKWNRCLMRDLLDDMGKDDWEKMIVQAAHDFARCNMETTIPWLRSAMIAGSIAKTEAVNKATKAANKRWKN